MNAARKLSTYLKPYWRSAVLAPLLMLLEVSMDLMQPRMIQRIVDEGIANLDLGLVIETGLVMVGLALVGVAGGVGCTIFAVMASQGFGADLREALFRKVQALSFGNRLLANTWLWMIRIVLPLAILWVLYDSLYNSV